MEAVVASTHWENRVNRAEQAGDRLVCAAESVLTLSKEHHTHCLMHSLIVSEVHLRLKTFSEHTEDFKGLYVTTACHYHSKSKSTHAEALFDSILVNLVLSRKTSICFNWTSQRLHTYNCLDFLSKPCDFAEYSIPSCFIVGAGKFEPDAQNICRLDIHETLRYRRKVDFLLFNTVLQFLHELDLIITIEHYLDELRYLAAYPLPSVLYAVPENEVTRNHSQYQGLGGDVVHSRESLRYFNPLRNRQIIRLQVNQCNCCQGTRRSYLSVNLVRFFDG